MQLVDAACYDAVMEKWFKGCKALGRTGAATKEEYFGFRSTDVATFHTHKQGCGAGVYFRLRDGRVYDTAAEEQDPDPVLYDQTTH